MSSIFGEKFLYSFLVRNPFIFPMRNPYIFDEKSLYLYIGSLLYCVPMRNSSPLLVTLKLCEEEGGEPGRLVIDYEGGIQDPD